VMAGCDYPEAILLPGVVSHPWYPPCGGTQYDGSPRRR